MQTMSSSKLYKNVNLAPFTECRRLMLWDRRRKVNEGGGSAWIRHNSLDIWRLFILFVTLIYEENSFSDKSIILCVFIKSTLLEPGQKRVSVKTFISYVKPICLQFWNSFCCTSCYADLVNKIWILKNSLRVW